MTDRPNLAPPMPTRLTDLAARIADHRARVCVMGLGYVGLPLVEALLETGFSVLGLDVDPQKVRLVQTGDLTSYHVRPEVFRAGLAEGRLLVSDRPEVLDRADVVVICVPTPLSKHRDPDLSYVIRAARTVAAHLHEGQLIVLESTTYPGTTREVLQGTLAARGLQVGRDYAVAFSPERIDPGNPRFGLRNTPKVVGGLTPVCRWLASLFYRQFVERVVEVSSPETAEMTKLLENIFRAINIGLVNEVALVCEKLGIDVWEVIEAASTKPFGFMTFWPGPGLGGHCIPVDPLYLSWRVRSLNTMVRFVDLADEVNRRMPAHVAHQMALCLNEHGKAVRGARVLLVGITYKPDVADIRESPANDIARYLLGWGADLMYHDPYVSVWEIDGGSVPRLAIETPTGPAWQALADFDLVTVVTDHAWYDYPTLVEYSPCIYDCRDAFRRRGVAPRRPDQIWKLGAPGPRSSGTR